MVVVTSVVHAFVSKVNSGSSGCGSFSLSLLQKNQVVIISYPQIRFATETMAGLEDLTFCVPKAIAVPIGTGGGYNTRIRSNKQYIGRCGRTRSK